ncbi:MAG: hypothetical protein H0X30_31875, partial [Anaerolineae bacterium]|nr:hypothetical protein [Anaerolineae bacterium]
FTLSAGLFAATPPNFIAAFQVLLGLLIISQSLLAIIRPRAWVLRALAVLLLVNGVWSLIILLLPGIVGIFFSIHILSILFALVLLMWAYRTYRLYRIFSARPTPKPTRALAQTYERIWEGLSHPTPDLSPELLMMQLQGNRYWWNGILLPERIVLAHKRRHVLIVADRPDFIVLPNNPKTADRDQFVIFAQIGLEAWYGRIYQGSFQLYQRWKGMESLPAEIETRIQRSRRARKFVQLSWYVLIVLIIFFYVTSFSTFLSLR